MIITGNSFDFGLALNSKSLIMFVDQAILTYAVSLLPKEAMSVAPFPPIRSTVFFFKSKTFECRFAFGIFPQKTIVNLCDYLQFIGFEDFPR